MNPSTVIKSSIGPLRWTVPSATTKGVTHTVTADAATGELLCNCLTRRTCWHVKAVAAGVIGKPRVRVTQRPIVSRTHAPVSGETRDLISSLDV